MDVVAEPEDAGRAMGAAAATGDALGGGNKHLESRILDARAVDPDLFELVVDTVPDRLALVAGDVRLTYWELDARANVHEGGGVDHAVGPGRGVGGIRHGEPVGLREHPVVGHEVCKRL